MQCRERVCAANWFTRLRRTLREVLQLLNGDTAYARYLAHWRATHAGEGTPLSRAEFFASETARRWNGVRRCC
ncbi:MAG: YbdD/YjiX family protein [Gammaproteobacteria bacterium]|nr:YbdD/YjiX family protein [Gammaproteobacteria bacterium]